MALLLLHAGVHAALATFKDHAADGTDDETESNDTDESVWHHQRLGEVSCRCHVSKADSEKRHIRPIQAIQIIPILDCGKYQRSNEEVHEKGDRLQHKSALTGRQHKVLTISARPGTVEGDNHERGVNEVEGGSPDAVVEGLRPHILGDGVVYAVKKGAGGASVEREEADG